MALDCIKVAFFDFDDTLAVWSQRKKKEFSFEGCLTDLIAHRHSYDDAVVPKGMVEFVSAISEYVDKMFVLTYERCSLWKDEKKAYVDKNYPKAFDDVIIAGRPEDKVMIMKAFAEAHRLKHCEVLFIDDDRETLWLARQEGFTVVNPMEIVSVTNPPGLAAQLAKGK